MEASFLAHVFLSLSHRDFPPQRRLFPVWRSVLILLSAAGASIGKPSIGCRISFRLDHRGPFLIIGVAVLISCFSARVSMHLAFPASVISPLFDKLGFPPSGSIFARGMPFSFRNHPRGYKRTPLSALVACFLFLAGRGLPYMWKPHAFKVSFLFFSVAGIIHTCGSLFQVLLISFLFPLTFVIGIFQPPEGSFSLGT